MNNEIFFEHLDRLVGESKIVIDRPRGSQHPRYPAFIYKVDYGYLQNTLSADGSGIDVYLGSLKEKRVNGIVVTADCVKRSSELQILVGCTKEEKQYICSVSNEFDSTKGLFIEREE